MRTIILCIKRQRIPGFLWTGLFMGKNTIPGGAEKLVDRRDKSKYEETLSEQECLQIENRMLRAENKKQQMEIDFLKNSKK